MGEGKSHFEARTFCKVHSKVEIGANYRVVVLFTEQCLLRDCQISKSLGFLRRTPTPKFRLKTLARGFKPMLVLVMFWDIIKMDPILFITLIPHIHTNSYKKRCRVDFGVIRE